MKKLLARTLEGKEFLHTREETFFVQQKNAKRICDILNKENYLLGELDKWYVYDYDLSQDLYTEREIYLTNKGEVKARYI